MIDIWSRLAGILMSREKGEAAKSLLEYRLCCLVSVIRSKT